MAHSKQAKAEIKSLEQEKKDFELKLQELAKDLNDIKEFEFSAVREDGKWLGWLGAEAKVTGADFNASMSNVRDGFKQTNDRFPKIHQLIRDVANMMDQLDQSYLPKIVSATDAALMASEQADRTSRQADRTSRELKEETERNDSRFDRQLEILTAFKKDIGKIKHVQDIDRIYDIVQSIEYLAESFPELERRADKTQAELKSFEDATDAMFDKAHDFTVGKLTALDGKVDLQKLELEKQFNTFELETTHHLADVDGQLVAQSELVVNNQADVEKQFKEQTAKMDDQNKSLMDDIRQLKEAHQAELATTHQTMKQKLMIAYGVGGIGVILGVVNLVMALGK